MTIFTDTSALLAFLDTNNELNAIATKAANDFAAHGDILVSSNYVVTETVAVCQRKFGTTVVRRFLTDTILMLNLYWIDEETHESAVAALLSSGRRDLSLVDCTSFEIMRRQRIGYAFAIDKHFRELGFKCVPEIG